MIVSRVIIDELGQMITTGHKVSKQDEAIKKFAKFWKYTSQDGYYPFKPMFLGRENYVLHRMIRFLESEHPTLRLSCRTWLS